jgi:Na+-transporting NADH:ubiquinone oxidoreductase subunit B
MAELGIGRLASIAKWIPRPGLNLSAGPVAPLHVTGGAPHIRDAITLNRAMRYMVVALIPCLFLALYNTGLQANLALASLGEKTVSGWRGAVLTGLGVGFDPNSVWDALWHGAVYFVPVLAVALMAGRAWEAVFARARGRPLGEGGAVVALLFALSLPPAVPLWQVALGISFGVVVGKEIFGGTGKNFLNPALAGLAFLYVTYPKSMIGQGAWYVVDGFTGPTSLQAVAQGGVEAIGGIGTTWLQAFAGLVPGPFGATSALAALIGACVLLWTGVVSARILAGVIIGMVATVLVVNQVDPGTDPFLGLPWYWHLTLGSFAFGTVFLATDPVTSAMTDTGRWIYGLLIGFMVVLIRVMDTAHPDGVMFAILIGNIFAPLIDHLVVRANIARRVRRLA